MESAGITWLFGNNLAEILSRKIAVVNKRFPSEKFRSSVAEGVERKTLTQRVEWIADNLRSSLPAEYPRAIEILMQILGPENQKETGMFTNFYWLMPVSKFVEKYGLEHFRESLDAIEEITKRNTGEYAIRPYVRKYPAKTLKRMKNWAVSDNFHLRRLASEGLRPKLPWASKLDLFIEKPAPVFEVLDLLRADHVRFVKKSVANHITDYIKVNPAAADNLIRQWKADENEHTRWILKHATRKFGGF